MNSETPRDQASPRLQGNGELVLVVEDNDKNARLTVAMLESAGYQTRLAVNGFEGHELARSLQPSLILADLQMPEMDGVTMTRLLRESNDTRAIPIIAVSAHALSEHRQAAMSAGCCEFLTKPFRYRELLEAVAAAIGGSSAAGTEKA